MTFNSEEKTELCHWLGINYAKLEVFVKRADRFDLHRLKSLEGKDALLASILAKVDMLHVQPNIRSVPDRVLSDGNFPGLDLEVNRKVLSFSETQDIIYVPNAVSSQSCDEVSEYYHSQCSYTMSKDRSLKRVGDNLITCWDEEFAKEMFILVDGTLDVKNCDRFSSSDWWQYDRDHERIQFHSSHLPQVYPRSTVWRPVGVTPLVRMLEYSASHGQAPHYDHHYIYENPKYRTLMSGLFFLTSNSSGSTRFIEDNQNSIPVWERNHDTLKSRRRKTVLQSFKPEKGSILLFDHKLCHDVEPYEGEGGDCAMIRFDVVFEAVNSTNLC